MRSTISKAVLVILGVTALAGALRFHNLDIPHHKVFDEVYYAGDGCWYAGYPYEKCGLESDVERSWVHPPLGKQIIGWGIDAGGNDPFGWRVAAAIAGTLSVGFLALLALLLTGSPVWAGVGGLLLATENLNFVQSRISMLDIFLALFVVMGFTFLVADRRAGRDPAPKEPDDDVLAELEPALDEVVETEADEAEAPPPPRDRAIWRPYRLLAGVSFGAAVAVKWSGALALFGALGLAVAWEIIRRDRPGPGRRPAHGPREVLGLLLSLAIVPALVYSATWIPWLADRSWDLAEFVKHHVEMADFHTGLDSLKENGELAHPYMSSAWTWPLLLRPVAYFWKGTDTTGAEILGVGHPFLFWGALVVLPYLAIRWHRDWTAGVPLVAFLSQYLPWVLVSRPLFLFYMAPMSPFLALGTTLALRDLTSVPRADRRFAVAGAVIVVTVCVMVFAFMWPILVGETIPIEAWRRRMWLPGWI